MVIEVREGWTEIGDYVDQLDERVEDPITGRAGCYDPAALGPQSLTVFLASWLLPDGALLVSGAAAPVVARLHVEVGTSSAPTVSEIVSGSFVVMAPQPSDESHVEVELDNGERIACEAAGGLHNLTTFCRV